MNKGDSKRYTFVWKIENFTLHYHRPGEIISSHPFIFENLNYSKWFLKLFPIGQSGGNEKYMSIFLCRDDDEKDEEIIIDYKIEAIDGNGERLDTLNESDKVFKGKESCGSYKFVKWEKLIKKIPNWKESILTVFCELSSKHVDRVYVSGCVARTKMGQVQHVLERNFHITDSSNCVLSISSLPYYLCLRAPVDEFEIDILPSSNSDNIDHRMTTITISLIGVKGKEFVSKRYFHAFNITLYYNSMQHSVQACKLPGFFSKSMLLKNKDTLLQGNKFTIKAEMSLHDGSAISTIKNYTRSTSLAAYLNSEISTINALLDNFRDMFVRKKYCDAKLRVGSQTIPIHKVVLAAQSEVFSVMFDQDMLESKTGIVDVQDMTVDAVNSLLEFMYTGSVKDLDYEKALELLIAADKYQVLSLEEMCSCYLMSVFSETNVCDVLATAEMIGYAQLKTSALEYIKKNYGKVMSSAKWPEWVETNIKLATEIILQLSNHISNAYKIFKLN